MRVRDRASGSSLASASSAASRNLLNCAGSSGFGSRFDAGFLLMGRPYQAAFQSSRMKTKASCGSGNGNRAQIRQYRVFSFGDRLRVSRFVSETLAPEAFQRSLSPRHIIYAQPFAAAVSEVELGQIAMQVCRANVEVAAGDTAFEDAEVVLDSVGVGIAADVLVGAVVHTLMLEVAPHLAVLARIVGVQLRLLVNLGHQDRPQVGGGKRWPHASIGHVRRVPPKRKRFPSPSYRQGASGRVCCDGGSFPCRL